MENNENKKTPEALADEALDQVAGGGTGRLQIRTCLPALNASNGSP